MRMVGPPPVVIVVRVKNEKPCHGAHPTLVARQALAVIVMIPEQLHRLAPSPILGDINHAVLTEVLLKRKKVKANFSRETEGREI